MCNFYVDDLFQYFVANKVNNVLLFLLCPVQAKYHEDFEKNIKGNKIQVTDDPESQRLKQLNSIISQVEYKGLKEKVSDMEARRPNVSQRMSLYFIVSLSGNRVHCGMQECFLQMEMDLGWCLETMCLIRMV